MRVYCYVVLIASLFLASCNTPATAPANLDMSEVAGTYTLATIDGHTVPYAPMHQGQQAPEVASGFLTLNADGTFTSATNFSNPEVRAIGGSTSGTFVQEGGEYILSWEGAGKTSVTIDGSTATMNNEGMLFVYTK